MDRWTAECAPISPARDRHRRRGCVCSSWPVAWSASPGAGSAATTGRTATTESFVDVSCGHTAIEQVNRLLSGLIGIPTLAMAIGSFRVRPPPRRSTGSSSRRSACWSPCSATASSAASPCAPTCIRRSSSRTSCWRWRRSRSPSSPSIALGPLAPARRADPVVADAAIGWLPRSPRSRRRRSSPARSSPAPGRTPATRTSAAGGSTSRRSPASTASCVLRRRSRSRSCSRSSLRREPSAVARPIRPVAVGTWMFVAVLQGGIGYVQYFTGVPGDPRRRPHRRSDRACGWSPCGCARGHAVESPPVRGSGRRDSRRRRRIHVASAPDMGMEPGRWTQSWRVLAGWRSSLPRRRSASPDRRAAFTRRRTMRAQSITGRVQNRSEDDDGERVTEPVPDVRVVVEDESGNVGRRVGHRRRRRVPDPDRPSRASTSFASTPKPCPRVWRSRTARTSRPPRSAATRT